MPAAIRPARASDIDAMLAIEQAVFPGDRLSRRSFGRLAGKESTQLLVLEDDGRVAGYCLVLFRKGAALARLYSVAVAPDQAGKGAGRMLLAAAEDAAARRDMRGLRLEVRKDNDRAIGLYRKSGYLPIGERAGYYSDGMAALRFEKTLSPPGGTASR